MERGGGGAWEGKARLREYFLKTQFLDKVLVFKFKFMARTTTTFLPLSFVIRQQKIVGKVENLIKYSLSIGGNEPQIAF